MAVKSPSREVLIELPPLHEGQLDFEKSTARFKVIMCGRRFGKTIYGVRKSIECAILGGRAWWVAPSYKIANEGWSELKKLAYQINDAAGKDFVDIREGDKQLVFPNGGMVEVRSSDVEGALRGAGLDLVVIDEAASHRETVWTEELRPALIDKRGSAIFIGTPKGDNWFAKLYKRASTNGFSNWQAWKKTTWDNPYISSEERKEIEEEYAGRPDKYNQEILAEIGSSQYLVYVEFNRELHLWKWQLPKFTAYYGGLDFGGDQQGSHKSAGIISGIDENDNMVCIDEFEESGPNITERQLNWIGQTEAHIKQTHIKYRYPKAPIFWAGDKSQMKFLDILKTYGFRVTPNNGKPGSVRAGVDLVSSRLAIRGEGKPRFFYLKSLTKLPDHFESYHNYEPRDGDNQVQRDNPVKVNDDLDDAIRYMVERKDGRVLGNPQTLFGNIIGAIR